MPSRTAVSRSILLMLMLSRLNFEYTIFDFYYDLIFLLQQDLPESIELVSEQLIFCRIFTRGMMLLLFKS